MHEGGHRLESNREAVTAYLSLGSNLGDRIANILDAIEELRPLCTTPIRRSALYETEPTDLEDQPWFINAVVEMETPIPPCDLLAACHRIEQSAGPEKAVRFGPRFLDIDLLLYGQEAIREADLEVPHPRMHERRFVLVPLLELCPEVTDPRDGSRFADVLERLDEGKKVLRSAITES